MLFVTLMHRKEGAASRETTVRRLDWHYPQGVKVLGEYWLPGYDPSVVVILEADDIGAIFTAVEEWDDLFEFRVFPATPAEYGLARVRERLATAVA